MKPGTPDMDRHAQPHEGDCAVDLGDTTAACCAPESKVASALRPARRTHSPRLLLACQDDAIRQVLSPLFDVAEAISVDEVSDGHKLDSTLTHEGPFDLVISQAALPGSRGLDALTKARDRGDETPFILVQSVHQNFVRITLGGGQHSIVSTRLVNVVALLDLVRQILFGDAAQKRHL